MVLVAAGCAVPPGPVPVIDDADSTATMWGDEHPGLLVDLDDRISVPSGGAVVELVDGWTRRANATVSAQGVTARARSSSAGDVGVVEWRGHGVLRQVTAGMISPEVAEGALVGNPRAGAEPNPSASSQPRGLGVSASASSYGAMAGGGVVVAPGPLRVALAGWQLPHDASARVMLGSLEHRTERTLMGVVGGGMLSPRATGQAVSIFGARADESSFLGGEIAVAADRVRGVARVVAGSRREWSAIASAGAVPSGEGDLAFAASERWGAAVERRDAWDGGASRLRASTSTRRGVSSEARRRRLSWDAVWPVSTDARVEFATRATRDLELHAATGRVAALPSLEVHDEWRARATLRARRPVAAGWSVENAYRLEWVEARTGRPGTMATWTCAVRAPGVEWRFAASAFALGGGQVVYSADSAPVGAASFEAVSGRGVSMSALVRARFRRHASLGVSWSQRPPGQARVSVFLTLRA